MGVKVFRDGSWSRLKAGIISDRDIMGLDAEHDRNLINWLLLHMDEAKRERVMQKCHISKLPEELINIDDPRDDKYMEYFVLLEQVTLENDREVLREAALHSRDSIGKFAFCRLTGYSWPADTCDAYSYRTYSCGLKSDVTIENAISFCRDMIEKNGPYAKEASEWMEQLRTREKE